MAIDRNFKRRIVLIVMILLWWASTTQAAVPLLINYQGSLTDDTGNPVDGTYTIQFYLYDAAIGGASQWNEEQDVMVSGGIYNVHLGSVNALSADIFMADGLYLEVVVYHTDTSTFEVMSPRQQLTSVPFAIQAGSTPAGAVTTVMLADEAVTETKVASAAITADKIDGGTGSGVDADLLDGLDADAFSPSAHNHDGSYYSQAHVDALEDRIAALEAKLQYLTVVAGSVNQMPGPHVMITGANLHVTSGSGSTDGPINGLGNLIVGYNELRGSGDDRTGSHTIVVGREHNFSSYGGLVGGYQNTISGPYASVSGGNSNTASAYSSSVSGGRYNTASGWYSSVSGGINNTASGNISSVSGGNGNTASGGSSSVSGGEANAASANVSSVSGGYGNTASGSSASASGGAGNEASGDYSFVGGGGGVNAIDGNIAFADYSAILGGLNNLTGDGSCVWDGGAGRYVCTVGSDHAIGLQATVSGGAANLASSHYSSVSGGNRNTASGNYSSVSGGLSNTASGIDSNVSGGLSNTASGIDSNVSGGYQNLASGNYSSVSAGRSNTASSYYSSVSGGGYNTADDYESSVSGGAANTASGIFSSISGGHNRSVSGNYDWQGGGLFQDD